MEPREMELESEERLLDDGLQIKSRKSWNHRRIRIAAIALLAIISVPLLLSPSLRHRSTATPILFGDCGSSLEEARAKGCEFDVISFTWLPPECHDPELVDDFLSLSDREWYQDPRGLDPAPREKVMNGEYQRLFVTREYHVYHCRYQWRKMHRGIQKRVIDSYIGSYNHTVHCEMMLMQVVPRSLTDTRINRKYIQCQRI
ncbi:hypothetical protein NA57DRAFT_70410 [Rhizodiscina lignyota]|uniref:Uncharacterized protein n=1 Tax=Rhizodiscina lignyota TaxID=1504668 RepID=A0A9P4IQG1_9PEZI|nr:hypothetical protein NA57DRAFT_70410 [Rhizodiscina lignyota]